MTSPLVLWDIDHTLIETRGIGGQVYAEAFAKVTGRALEKMPPFAGRTEPVIFREALQVALHDAGFKVPLPPQGRYNAAQRITYSAIVLMGGLSLLTGLAIYKPAQLHWLTALLGGYQWARWEHFWLTMGYVGFFVIHIAQVIRAGWPNFRAMVSGYDLVEVPAVQAAPTLQRTPEAEMTHGD